MFDRSLLWSNDERAARGALETLLTECQGNVTLASRRAGIERQSMHRLLKRHGLSARDFRPRGGGSVIARAALKNLDQQLTPPQRSRELTRAQIREVEVRRPGVMVTHPAAIEHDVRRPPETRAASGTEQDVRRDGVAAAGGGRERSAATASASLRERAPSSTPAQRRERASLASPSFERRAAVPQQSAEDQPPRLECAITAGGLADRAFERRRAAAPHHRPYQSPLGAAALAALALRKTAAG
jgi:hypothetical protein